MDDEKLTVYCIEVGEVRKIVATQNPYRAARLLEISRHLFGLHARTTESEDEVEVALSDPGAVWARHIDIPDWIKCASSRRARGFAPQGGHRSGAGRPRSAPTLRRQRCISADDQMWSTFRERGGTPFLEQALASGLAPSDAQWTQLSALGGSEWLRVKLNASTVASEDLAHTNTVQEGSSKLPAGEAGLPRAGDGQRKPRSVSTDDDTWALFLQRGGTRFLRALIASGINFTNAEWDAFRTAGGQLWLNAVLGGPGSVEHDGCS